MRSALASLLLALFVVTPLSSVAAPTLDPGVLAALAKQLGQLQLQYHKIKQSYEELEETYANAKLRLTEAKEIAKDAEGHYGYGSLLNSAADLDQREWSPDSWQDTLHGMSGGNAARYQQLVHLYKKNHPTLSQSRYTKGASKAKAVQYKQQIQTNQAANVNSQYAFNTVKKHLQNVHSLSKKIEQAPNTKAAVDLNSRLLTEIAYIQVQALKQQAILNQQIAQRGADAIAAQTQAAKFIALPTLK